jgi:DNA primase
MDKPPITEVLKHYGAKNVREDVRGWRKICCPFHNDSIASATYSTEADAFNCFGCGIKGDSYKIIMEREGIGFREAYLFAEETFAGSSREVQPKSISGRRLPVAKRIDPKRRKPLFARGSD